MFVGASRQRLGSSRDNEIFEKHKLLKFWLQSFLADVPSVVVGFRDERGRVLELKTYETKTIHRLVRGGSKGPGGAGYWEPATCFNFGKAVLEWALEQIASAPAGKRFVMRYDPAASAVTLSPDDNPAASRASGAQHDDEQPAAKRARA